MSHDPDPTFYSSISVVFPSEINLFWSKTFTTPGGFEIRTPLLSCTCHSVLCSLTVALFGEGGVGSGVFSAVNICSFPRPSERELTLFLDPVNSELWSYSFPGPSEVTLFLVPLKLLFSSSL